MENTSKEFWIPITKFGYPTKLVFEKVIKTVG